MRVAGRPRPSLAERRAKSDTARRVIRLFAGHRRSIAVLSFAVLLSAGLGLGIPLLTKAVFDHGLFPTGGHPHVRLLVVLVATMVAFGVLSGLASIWQTYLSNVVGQEVMHDLRDQLYSHLQGMSLRFFTATRTGEIQSRIANDIGGVSSAVTSTFATFLSDSAIGITALVAMALLSWQMTLLSVAVLPMFMFFNRRIGRMRREMSHTIQELLAEMSVATEETLSVSGALLSKISARGDDAVERYRADSRRLAQLRVRQQMISRTFTGLTSTFLMIIPALVYLIAGISEANGSVRHLTAGTLVAFLALQARLYGPVCEMLGVSLDAQSAMALFERVFEYLDMPHDIVDAPDATAISRAEVRGAVTLRNVYFTYESQLGELVNGRSHSRNGHSGAEGDNRPEWALRDVSLEVRPGELAAIVGPSGAGKTTISYLIPRLYDPARGIVEIDGTDIRQIRLASLAEIIGMVTQDTYLFHATVRENLLYAKPHATSEEVEQAARAAAIHERILEMPHGYDTLVGERGYRLSGGEKQRLAIARVLLKGPQVLILDEATSSLDTRNERLVQAALAPLMHNRTTIAIAHRLSTILAADTIFVLDRGQIVERGAHNELVRTGGLYAELYHHQFHDGRLEARCNDGVVLSSGEVAAAAAA
jgi:ATP-binding cassette subfamily B protein